MTDATGEEFLKLWEGVRNGGITQEQHAKQLGLDYIEYKERYYEAMGKRRYKKFIEDNQGELYKPELFQVAKYKPLEFTAKSFIAICDIHVPCTDYDYAMLPAQIARRHLPEGERVLVVHGDIFNQDVFSKWPKIVKDPTWEQERQAASNLFAIWAKTFDSIIVMPGNHDYRIMVQLGGQVSFSGVMWSMLTEQDQDLAQMFGSLFSTGKLTVSPVDHCFIDTPKGKYIVVHGASYSINPLTVANDYSQKYQAHVISGHEHHVGMTIDRYGRYMLINNGGLFEKDKFSYVTLQANKRPVMKKGFTLVKDGYPHVFGPWTDWRMW